MSHRLKICLARSLLVPHGLYPQKSRIEWQVLKLHILQTLPYVLCAGCCIAESHAPLTCSDVLVQSTAPGKLQDDKGDEAGHVTSPASDFVLELRRMGIPACVIAAVSPLFTGVVVTVLLHPLKSRIEQRVLEPCIVQTVAICSGPAVMCSC